MKKIELFVVGIYIVVLTLIIFDTVGRNVETARLNRIADEEVIAEANLDFYNLGYRDGVESMHP